MIRVATIDDLEILKKMAENFMQASPYAKFGDMQAIERVLVEILTDSTLSKIAFLYEDKGMLVGMANPFLYGTHKSATELAWWVEPEFRGTAIGAQLISAFENWAKNIGCSTVTMISIDDNVGKYYEKNGYVLYERAYLKEL